MSVPATRSRGFWTEQKVAWYRRANARSDYADRVLRAAEPLLGACRSALDVGAGFGALAVPLAQRLGHVTALEPAPAMAAALREEATRAGLTGLRVIEAAWGDVTVEPHDAVVCAHVGPLLGCGGPFLAGARTVARRGVVIVRDVREVPGDDKFFYRELYPRLLGRPYDGGCDVDDTLAALAALGVTPTVTHIVYDSGQPFESLEEACDFWMTYMELEGEAPRAYLRGFLAERLTREGSGWLAPFRKQAAVIQWLTAPRKDAP
jgi:SAM-dependent methyltransferase